MNNNDTEKNPSKVNTEYGVDQVDSLEGLEAVERAVS